MRVLLAQINPKVGDIDGNLRMIHAMTHAKRCGLGQADQDTLPPYPLLDTILEAYVEDGRSSDEITTATGESDWVARVVGMVDRNEYKRKQAALGLRVTSRSFGTGWRMPIVAEYRAF